MSPKNKSNLKSEIFTDKTYKCLKKVHKDTFNALEDCFSHSERNFSDEEYNILKKMEDIEENAKEAIKSLEDSFGFSEDDSK